MSTCTKRGCDRRTFMDTDRCFDHQRGTLPPTVGAWFGFCILVALAVLGVGIWAVVELVTWVTSR